MAEPFGRFLTGDSELTAEEAGIDTTGPVGIAISDSPENLASAAILWFADRIRSWELERPDPPGRTSSKT
jgi:hypothetical protein